MLAAFGLLAAIALDLAVPAASGPLRVDRERLVRSLETLSAFGRNPEGGVTRLAWSPEDIAARRWVVETAMAGMGLAIRVDAAGSIYGRREGTEKLPVLLFGSHIDSVPMGGNFDGDVGAMAAIEVMRTLYEKGIRTRHPLECVIWSNEEGTRHGRALFGSRAAVGELEPAELELKDADGVPIRELVRGVGGDLSRVAEAQRRPGEIAAYLELHVEQGGTLDRAGIPIGVVEGIVGIRRYDARVTGFANHAGTTPMAERQDALVAAAQLVLAVREETMRSPGRQVATVGRLAVSPGAPNVIPGQVDLTLEQRDLSLDTIDEVFRRIERRAAEIGRATGTTIEFRRTHTHEPALATPWVREIIAREAAALGLATRSLPSGAGHDAQMLAKIAPMGMIFVPSVGGISHSPKERTLPSDVGNGGDVLLNTVLAVDRR